MPTRLRLLRPYGARHANRDFLAAAVLATLLTIAFGAWMALRPEGGAQSDDALRRFGEAGAALIAAVACMVAATFYSGRSRFAWVLLGTGALAWAAGEGIGAYYEFIGEQLRYTPLTDIGHLVAVPLAVAGIAVFPGRHRGASRIAFLLDGAILAGALVLISWATVLGGVYHAHTGVGASALTALAYPISDIVMAVMALLLVGRTAGYGRLPLLLVMTGIFANLLADSASVYLTTVTGHAPAEIMSTGWVAGFLLMALGGIRASLLAGAAPRGARPPAGSLGDLRALHPGGGGRRHRGAQECERAAGSAAAVGPDRGRRAGHCPPVHRDPGQPGAQPEAGLANRRAARE